MWLAPLFLSLTAGGLTPFAEGLAGRATLRSAPFVNEDLLKADALRLDLIVGRDEDAWVSVEPVMFAALRVERWPRARGLSGPLTRG